MPSSEPSPCIQTHSERGADDHIVVGTQFSGNLYHCRLYRERGSEVTDGLFPLHPPDSNWEPCPGADQDEKVFHKRIGSEPRHGTPRRTSAHSCTGYDRTVGRAEQDMRNSKEG